METATANLTRRELEVLALVADGLSDAEIGEKLSISKHTVSKHVANILETMGHTSRTGAAVAAVRQHIIP